MKYLTLLSAAFLMWSSSSNAQDQAPKVECNDLKVELIQTPQFQAANVPERRWRPKSWMLLDMEFEVKLPPSAGGRDGTLGGVTVNYYIALNHSTKEGKREMLKGMVNYTNIPSHEKAHALVFISPASLKRIFMKDNVLPTDVQGWGVEIMVDGQLAGGKSSIGGKWWEKTESFEVIDGDLLVKQETPFSILWGDYDVKAKK